MKSVLISIKPKWCEKIIRGKKTIEVRKSAPKQVPFKAYIYCSYGNDKENYMLGGCGKVICEFICDKVYSIKNQGNSFVVANEERGVTNEIARKSCLDYYDMDGYLGNKDGYGWHISDLKIYDKPKYLSEFKKGCNGCKERDSYHCYFYCYGERPLTRPPQSWCYVEEEKQ